MKTPRLCVKNGRVESFPRLEFAVSLIGSAVNVFVGVSGSSKVASIASMSWFPRICLSSTPVKENASGLQL